MVLSGVSPAYTLVTLGAWCIHEELDVVFLVFFCFIGILQLVLPVLVAPSGTGATSRPLNILEEFHVIFLVLCISILLLRLWFSLSRRASAV